MDCLDHDSPSDQTQDRRFLLQLGIVFSLTAALLLGAELASAACVPGPGCPDFAPVCKWTCNGDTYAWEIQMHVDTTTPDSGPALLQVDSTVDHCDDQICTPFYLYMPRSAWLNECSTLPGGCTIDGTIVVELWSNPLDGNPDTPVYVNAQGSILSGQIIGVAKDAGDWHPISGQITTSELTLGLPFCGNTRQAAIMMVNAYGDFSRGGGLADFPDLECIPAPAVTDVQGSDMGEPACLPPNIMNENNSQFMVGVDGDFWDYMALIDECLDENVPNLPPVDLPKPSCGGQQTPMDLVDRPSVISSDLRPAREEKISSIRRRRNPGLE